MGNNIQNLEDRLSHKTTITLEEYIKVLQNEGKFVIPDYQRGYVWGQRKKNDTTDSVTYLIKTLKECYNENIDLQKEIFLQGITVHEVDNSYDIVLVDGQQRTTFFYLLLKFLGYEEYLKVKYEIRNESNAFLENLVLSDNERSDDEKFQDIFFFKRTLRIFQRELKDYDKKSFLDFILHKVKFLFVIIPSRQAKIVFTMMNGNKAKMTDEELIKAELLRCASLKHELIEEAEHAELRGRLAREWDSWLYWWNDDQVCKFFKTEGRQLGWLLPLIYGNNKVTYKEFRNKLLKNQNIKQSKAVFKSMRLLQKSIEDKYNNSISYNYIGVILYIRKKSEQIFAFLKWYFNINANEHHTKSDEELKRYYDWSIINVHHEDIVANRIDKYNEARDIFERELNNNLLFINNYEFAYRWLIRQNIKQDNRYIGRKFNFEIERDRSLEHIYPKSKIGHKNEEGKSLSWEDKLIDEKDIKDIKLWREEIIWHSNDDGKVYSGTEHCIGNLLLLYKRDNSKFKDADFRQKNKYFFTIDNKEKMDDEAFKSRHLIHTTMIFSDIRWEDEESKTPWNKEQIARRKHEELIEFNNEYPELTE